MKKLILENICEEIKNKNTKNLRGSGSYELYIRRASSIVILLFKYMDKMDTRLVYI